MALPKNSAAIQKLVKMYRNSYLEILKTININNIYGRGQYRKAALLAQVQKELEGLDSKTKLWIEQNIPETYQKGATKAISGMRKIGVEVNDFTFSSIHKEAIKIISNDAYSAFAEALKTVRKDVERTFTIVEKQELIDRIGEGIIQGATRKEVVGQVQNVLNKQGITGLVDKGDKRWQLDDYADMLTRTKMAEAQRLGEHYAMIENGQDLVQISAHMTSCPSCSEVEGMVCSLTGATPGYPTLDDIQGMADHIFGPNCRHDTMPYSPDYDEMSDIFKELSGSGKAISTDILQEAGFKK